MKAAKTITSILFLLFAGLIVGGVIANNPIIWISGCILIIIDAIVGVCLYYVANRDTYVDDSQDEFENGIRNNLSFEENYGLGREQSDNNCDDSDNYGEEPLCDEYEYEILYEEMGVVISHIKEGCGARIVETIYDSDEAAQFLLSVCERMLGTQSVTHFEGLYLITIGNLKETPSLTYTFKVHKEVIGSILNVYLVRDVDNIRFFTVEISFPYALCEYKDGKHINYGQMDLQSVPQKIESILAQSIFSGKEQI